MFIFTKRDESRAIGGSLCDQLLRCPFCGALPEFTRWEGRELIILQHKCRWVDFNSTRFPGKLQECADEWNVRIPQIALTPNPNTPAE